MTKPLTGAAKTAHDRRVLIDAARDALTRRDPDAIRDTLKLLTAAAALTPGNTR